jgi:hypothetical protein
MHQQHLSPLCWGYGRQRYGAKSLGSVSLVVMVPIGMKWQQPFSLSTEKRRGKSQIGLLFVNKGEEGNRSVDRLGFEKRN